MSRKIEVANTVIKILKQLESLSEAERVEVLNFVSGLDACKEDGAKVVEASSESDPGDEQQV